MCIFRFRNLFLLSGALWQSCCLVFLGGPTSSLGKTPPGWGEGAVSASDPQAQGLRAKQHAS